MRQLAKLSTKRIGALKEPGRYNDGGGLYLYLSNNGAASWVFRYQLAKRMRDMGLGGYPAVSLAEARKAAADSRAMLKGVIPRDPLDERKARKDALRAETAKRITFKDAAKRHVDAHKAGWRNSKHAAQWPATLESYAHPVIGNLPVSAIEIGHIMKVLEPIWATKTETASRLRGRIEAVLDWAKTRGYRSGENPARWKGHLENLLPKRTKVRTVRHQPAMAFADVPAFAAELRATTSISARALELLILTATRTNEAISAQWSEFDLAAKVWTIPASRTKSGREHRVPLSDRAVALLRAMPTEKDSPWVFPGGRARQPLSNMAMLELLRGMRPGLTVHGFRSTFRDWAGEQTNFPREIAEAALGHISGDKVELAYRRGDALEKRRKLMTAWAQYCQTPTKAIGENVTPIRKAAE